MLRIVIYSLLLLLIVLTAYHYFTRSATESTMVTERETGTDRGTDRDRETGAARNTEKDLIEPDETASSQFRNDEPVSVFPETVEYYESRAPIKEQEQKKIKKRESVIIVKAQEQLRTGDYERALELLKKIPETNKDALIGIGMSYYKMRNYTDAIYYFEKVLDSHDNDFAALKMLAFSYYEADDIGKSIVNVEKGLSLRGDPELQELYTRLIRENQTQNSYIHESTDHFKVLFDGYEHGSVDREVLSILDGAYRHIGQELDYFPSERVTVILYTDKDFHDTTQAPSWSGGRYDGKIRLPIRGVAGQNRLLKRVLFHEYTHALIHSLNVRCPAWINEGLAEYFSGDYQETIGQVIPLNYLERSFSMLQGKKVRVAYWESYSAVSYLIEKYGLYRMKKMLLSLSRGNDINQAFKDSFSITYEDFISEWGKD